jgi:O-antigen/teichoic acid export membrane protein
MTRRQVLRNASFSVLQVVVVAATLLVLYRILLETIGIQKLGIWSLVLASTSLTGVGGLGMPGSIVKFVAKYDARGERRNAERVVQTALWSIAIFSGILLIAVYPACSYLLSVAMPAGGLLDARSILPHALFSVWLMLLASVVYSALDGLQRFDLRGSTLVVGSVLNLGLCAVLASRLGLTGVAWAKIGQNAFLLVLSTALLAKCLRSASWLRPGWSRPLFKESFGYGINFQLMSLTNMLLDPTTKGLLSKFGSLEMLGYYEMAARLVTQLRSIIVSANAVLVPVVAEQQEKRPENVARLYLATYSVLFTLALPAFALLMVCLPVISTLLIGRYEPMFALFGSLLCAGWFLNTLNAPAFFTYMGIGELGWSLTSQVAVAILNVALGVALGMQFDGVGVVCGWVLALSIGSSLVYLSFHGRYAIRIGALFPVSSTALAIVCLLAVSASILVQLRSSTVNTMSLNLVICAAFGVSLAGTLWMHPLRRRLMKASH